MPTFARSDFDESVERFHHRPVTEWGRQLWVPRLPTAPTLVLGSTQSDAVVDRTRAAAAGVDVVRRRSGGGAVLVSAADVIWFDLVIGRDDVLWSDDVGHAFEWLGRACHRGLARLGHRTEIHRGAPLETRWSRSICFAGVGWGELTLDGAKVVGISQRRTRNWARFQVAVLRRWRPDAYLDLFRLDHAERGAALDELDRAAVGIGDDAPVVLEAVTAELP